MAPKKQKQDRDVRFRVSERFRSGLNRAVEASGEPNLSEFIKRCLIEKARTLGVAIKR